VKRRGETEDDSGENGDHDCEGDHPTIDLEFGGARQHVARKGADGAHEDDGQCNAYHSSRRAKHRAFGQELPDDAAA
jgi:hypothetical protein